jgi:methionyl-tRNA formyltransferase
VSRLSLVFMGTPAFAVPSLAGLMAAGHGIAAVYCQPPRPAGRGQKPRPAPVQQFAEARGLRVMTPARLRTPEAQAAFQALAPDAAVVAAYGLILPQAILDVPRLGCLNVHASLLPRWRGAAPIQRALLAGDGETGITIMQMDAGLDTGPMLMQARVPIGPETTAAELHEALAALGARLVVQALAGLADGSLVPAPQPAEGVTYAPKLDRAEGRLDWRQDAALLDRQVRALNPWPGVWLERAGEAIKVLAAIPEAGVPGAAPGTVLDERALIACGRGALRLRRLQRTGRQPMDSEAFLRGYALAAGTRLDLT